MMNPIWQADHDEILEDILEEFTGVIGFAELLQKDDDRRSEYALEVLQSAERALALVRVLSGKVLQSPAPRTCRINEVVLDLEPSLRRVVGPSIPLEVRIYPSFDTIPLGKRDLEGLLLCLVAAARDAYSSSPGPIRVRTEGIKRGDDTRVSRIVVEDEAGIPQAGDMRWFLWTDGPCDLLNSLSPFAERAREAGGQIRIESQPGDRRTRVYVEFPIDRARDVGNARKRGT